MSIEIVHGNGITRSRYSGAQVEGSQITISDVSVAFSEGRVIFQSRETAALSVTFVFTGGRWQLQRVIREAGLAPSATPADPIAELERLAQNLKEIES